MTIPHCCGDCCPEPVDVTVQTVQTIIDGLGALVFTWTPGNLHSDSGILEASIEDDGVTIEGSFLFKIWFVDTNDPTATKSAISPTTPGANEIDIVSALLTGIAQLTVSNTAADRDWYACAEYCGAVKIVGPLELGI